MLEINVSTLDSRLSTLFTLCSLRTRFIFFYVCWLYLPHFVVSWFRSIILHIVVCTAILLFFHFQPLEVSEHVSVLILLFAVTICWSCTQKRGFNIAFIHKYYYILYCFQIQKWKLFARQHIIYLWAGVIAVCIRYTKRRQFFFLIFFLGVVSIYIYSYIYFCYLASRIAPIHALHSDSFAAFNS